MSAVWRVIAVLVMITLSELATAARLAMRIDTSPTVILPLAAAEMAHHMPAPATSALSVASRL